MNIVLNSYLPQPRSFARCHLEIKERVANVAESLGKIPRPSGVRKLQGHERLYRIRVGQYRLVYEIDDQHQWIRITQD